MKYIDYLIFILLLILVFFLTGCDKYQNCVEKEIASYRNSNPNASYNEALRQQRTFEIVCSKYKAK